MPALDRSSTSPSSPCPSTARPPSPGREGALLGSLALLWYGLIWARPGISTLWCAVEPTPCTREAILFPMDRWVVGWDSPIADTLSFATEYAAGLLAFVSPWLGDPKRRGRIWLALVEATLWNGILMEFCRNWAQRPRPFVYEAPLAYGKVVSHYTSFYSGHTSFAALASVVAWWAVREETTHRPRTRYTVLIAGLLLTLSTGLLRVFAARHFFTDVLFGALAGTFVGWTIGRRRLL